MASLKPKQQSRFPIQTYYFTIVVLSLAGIVTSISLSLTHYWNYTDVGYQSFCAISRSLNCDTVAQSPYSIFFGVPIATWGIIGYTFFFVLSLSFKPSQNSSPAFSLLCLVAGIFSLASTGLAGLSSHFIKSYCVLCFLCYGINFCLFLITWMAQQRFGDGIFFTDLKSAFSLLVYKRSQIIAICAVFTFLIITSLIFYPKYWKLQTFPVNQNIEYGVTADQSPWIGAQNPTLTITEFSDYMCFQCGKMHNHLRQLVSKYPHKLRLVHRHFPLDHRVNPLITEQIHPNSGLLAMFSIVAQEAGLFWQINDILFRDAREKKYINFNAIAKEVGLDLSNLQQKLNEKKLNARLAEDIRTGLQLGVSSTPSYLIDGKLYHGTIPADVLTQLFKGN